MYFANFSRFTCVVTVVVLRHYLVVKKRSTTKMKTTKTKKMRERRFFYPCTTSLCFPEALDALTFDLFSLGNRPAAVPFSHGRKFLLPLLQGRGD